MTERKHIILSWVLVLSACPIVWAFASAKVPIGKIAVESTANAVNVTAKEGARP